MLELKEWDDSSRQAAAYRLAYMVEELRSLYFYPITAPKIWSLVMNTFHRQDPGSLIRSFEAITSLPYVELDEQTIVDHIGVDGRL